jgi:hypothetical protein
MDLLAVGKQGILSTSLHLVSCFKQVVVPEAILDRNQNAAAAKIVGRRLSLVISKGKKLVYVGIASFS